MHGAIVGQICGELPSWSSARLHNGAAEGVEVVERYKRDDRELEVIKFLSSILIIENKWII